MSKKIALITGGFGPERNVKEKIHYQITESVIEALDNLNYEYKVIELNDIEAFVDDLKKYKPDVVYLTVYGKYSEDGNLQGLLNFLKIKYTGPGILASSIANNKHLCKTFLSVDSPKGICITSTKDIKENLFKTFQKDISPTFPVVVKPNKSGSSYGVSFCQSISEVEKSVDIIIPGIDNEVLIEEFIPGNEVTIYAFKIKGILYFSPPIEIIFAQKEKVYATSIKGGISKEDLSKIAVKFDSLTKTSKERIIETTKSIYETLQCRGLVRLDYRLKNTEDGICQMFLEVNTIPGVRRCHLKEILGMMGWEYEDLIRYQIDEAAYD